MARDVSPACRVGRRSGYEKPRETTPEERRAWAERQAAQARATGGGLDAAVKRALGEDVPAQSTRNPGPRPVPAPLPPPRIRTTPHTPPAPRRMAPAPAPVDRTANNRRIADQLRDAINRHRR